MRILRLLTVALLSLVAACGEREDVVVFGAKNFTESRILAEMMLALAEEQDIPTGDIVDYPTTQAILAALEAGDIDGYPDYNGTGLVMLGQNPISDGDEATERVKALFKPLGLTWLDRIGFANNYGLAMRADRAAELGVTSISDLVGLAEELSIAIEDDFEVRPLDGYGSLTDRYGLDFESVEVVSLDDRTRVFDLLIDGDVDVAEVYTTDAQIAEYDLTVLEDDLDFFPVYEAAPLVRADTLAQYPDLGPALSALAGRVDVALMRELNGRVEIEGRSARAIARDALARMDLIDAGAVEVQEPLYVAAEPSLTEGEGAPAVLRAVQRAFTGRDVQFLPTFEPLAAVGAGEARLALVGADAFYDVSTPAPQRRRGYEAVAATGQNVVHVVAAADGPRNPEAIERLAVGPVGSSSARIGRIVSVGLGLSAEPVVVEGGAREILAAVAAGDADAALAVAPEGDAAVEEAMAGTDLRLLSLAGWSEGANLVRYPFLRETRIAAGTYDGQLDPTETVRTQLVLAGPAPDEGDAVGDQGPAAVAAEIQPLSATAVTELNAALQGNPLVDPILPLAESLAPEMPQAAAAINPAPDISLLSLALVVFFVWLVWLLFRPEYR